MVDDFYDKLGLINKLDTKHDVEYDKSDKVNRRKEINVVPVPLMLSLVSSFTFSSSDCSKPNIGWFVNDISTTIFKYSKGVISTFKSISHSMNLVLVEAVIEVLTMIKGVGRKLFFFLVFY